MAANYQQVYTMNVGINSLCSVIRSFAFANTLHTELKVESATPYGYWFQLNHGISLTSWGEKITINLTQLSDNTTQVEIRSECMMPTQIFDWGKNKQVVFSIYQFLSANTGSAYGSQPQAQQVPMQNMMAGSPTQPTYCFCKVCGARNQNDASFCVGCGNKIQ